MKIIKSNNYQILISNLINTNFDFSKYSKIAILTDENTYTHCLPLLIQNISSLKKANIIQISSGEKNKNLKTCNYIWTKLLKFNFDKNSLLVNLGGGMICDIGGFCASTFKRGVDFVNIPTTLLAQVDASVGGKTAINHPLGKNMIGAFHQPVKVITDMGLLRSLSKRQINEGLAEIIKHSLLSGDKFFEWLYANFHNLIEIKDEELEETVYRSIEIKASIVEQDEREQGIRKILNLGHTYGHAIELYGGYSEFSHGEAVAIGMIMALNLSIEEVGLKVETADKIKKLISKILSKKQSQMEFKAEKLLNYMSSDKKKVGNNLNFILLSEIGQPKIVSNVDSQKIMKSMIIS